MQAFDFIPGQYTRAVRTITVLAFVLWTLVLAASLAWNIYQQSEILLETARVMARTAFQKDLLYRHWASEHGGVYVPVDESTRPNPYLAGYPGQNITAVDGTAYTLINPAYMLRQVYDMQDEPFNVYGHITSLKPLRPGNAPDAWEAQALLSLEDGIPEVSALESLNGRPMLRMMLPLQVEESCLACHASQGYRIGEIRGGISESVGLDSLEAIGKPQRAMIISGHVSIWMVGLAGIFFFSRSLRRSIARQQEAETKLLHMSIRDSLTGLYNRRYFEDTFKKIQDEGTNPVTFLTADLDNLKKVNDTLGHAAGDALLRGAAGVLRASFRAEDVIARVGGDEFVVIVLGRKPDQIENAIQRIRTNETLWNESHSQAMLRLSIGAASAEHYVSHEAALKAADERMYADKSARKAQRNAKPA